MRAKVMTWNACAAVPVESGTLESLGWGETHVTFNQRILILRSTCVAEQGDLGVVAIGCGSWGLTFKSLDSLK
jgi:hypothetical protein